MKFVVFEYIVCFLFLGCSPKVFVREQYLAHIEKHDTVLTAEQLERFINLMKKYHPYSFDSLGGRPTLGVVAEIGATLPQNRLNDGEIVFQARKLMDLITLEDPHFRIIPVMRKHPDLKFKTASITVPPFLGLCINDSLLVHSTYNKGLRRGDLIKSINNIPVNEYLHHYYPDRYMDIGNLVWYNNYQVYPQYIIDYVRDGLDATIMTDGVRYTNYAVKEGLFCNGKLMPDYSLGYFRIRTFENNGYILKKFRKFVESMKQSGYSNLIIDLRENPGGSGDNLNLFFSVFSNKDSLCFLKDGKVRASKATKDYGYEENQYGQLLSMPSEDMLHSFALDSLFFVPGLDVYVLVSRSTGSIAASFANICQYNQIATLVGEPLARNALKYGEIVSGAFIDNLFGLSTVMFDEYTKSNDGIVYPDISIPYIASEYMNGGDPVLEKLLMYLNNKKAVITTKNE